MTERMVDFTKVKEQVPIERLSQLVDFNGVFDDLETDDDGFSGDCPIHGGGHFHISTAEQCWLCKHGKDDARNSSGNVIDLVATVLELPSKRAAVYLADAFELDDVAYQKVNGQTKKRTADTAPAVAPESNDNSGGQREGSEAPSAHDFLNATMTIQAAIEKLKRKEVDANDLVVVDVSTLRFLHDLMTAEQKEG